MLFLQTSLNAPQARIRGYLAKAEAQLKEEKCSEKQELLVQQMVRLNAISSTSCDITIIIIICLQIKEFKTRLKESKYHGSYFDRSSEKKMKICDDTGINDKIK